MTQKNKEEVYKNIFCNICTFKYITQIIWKYQAWAKFVIKNKTSFSA